MPRFAFAFLAVLLMTQSAAAVLREWSGAVDNKWATAGNWSPGGVPATGDFLIFPFEATVRTTQNDLGFDVILASVSMVGAYTVSGSTIMISGGTNGGCQATFLAPVEAQGDLTLSAQNLLQLNPGGHTVNLQCGDVDHLIGDGELITGYSGIVLNGAQTFSGTVEDGYKVGAANFLQIDNLSMPNATFEIGAGLIGFGQIGPLTASGWVQPSTTSSTVAVISTHDLRLTTYSGLPEETGEYEVDLVAAGNNDVLQVTGSVTLENKPLNVNLGFTPTNGATFVIIDNDGSDAVSGIFVMRANPTANLGTPLPEGATFEIGGQNFQISYVGGTGNDVVLTAVPDTTPTSISATASASGNTVTVQASLTPSGATGTVTVKEGPTVLGSATLSSGSATVQFARFSGAHTFTVEYSGDGTFAASSTFADVTVGDPALSIGDAVANEDASQAEVTVTLTGPATENTVSVLYQTSNGTAIAGEDYAATSGTLVFFPGQTSRTLLVPLYPDDHPEEDEWLEVMLDQPSNATIADGIGRVTIANDDANFTLLGDIEYAPSLFLDLRIPIDGAGPFPLVIVIDAANWLQATQHTTIADFLPVNGFAVATLSFRSAAGALFPAQLDDVRHAITYLRGNALRFQLDTLRMAMLGNGRAGGHLAALAAVTDGSSQQFDAVVVAEAATDLALIEQNHCAGKNDVEKLLGCAPSHCMTAALDASPVTHVSGGDPPFFLLNTGDACGQDAALLDALRAAHVGGTVLYVTNFEVPAPGWDAFVVQASILNFLEARLKDERTGRRRAIRK